MKNIIVLTTILFANYLPSLAWSQCNPPPAQQLLPSGVALSDNFGASIAVSGDRAIVGANLADGIGTNSGSAYIFHWNGSNWAQEQKLVPSDTAAYDLFGLAVAIDGDRAVVVAPGKYVNAVQTGATYVFKYNGSSWVEEQKLPVGVSEDGDGINAAVAISGNVIVVGKANDSTKAYYGGAANIFSWNGSTWVQAPKLFASDAAGGDFFGNSVAAFSDWVMVGSYMDDDMGQATGAVYAFKRNDNGTPLNANDDFWQQMQKLVPADGVPYVYFGKSVAIDGNTLVIGAFQDGTRGLNFGSAYVYQLPLNGSTWVYQTELFGSGSSTNGFFGSSVAVSGNAIVVGGYKEDPSWMDGGSAYVFRKNGSTWTQESRLADPNVYANNYFGYSVAVSNGRALVSAPRALGTGTANSFTLCGAQAPSIVSSSPPDNFIDPLEDRDATSGAIYGLQDVSITFSAPVTSAGGQCH